jgi:hypothetical protein
MPTHIGSAGKIRCIGISKERSLATTERRTVVEPNASVDRERPAIDTA